MFLVFALVCLSGYGIERYTIEERVNVSKWVSVFTVHGRVASGHGKTCSLLVIAKKENRKLAATEKDII